MGEDLLQQTVESIVNATDQDTVLNFVPSVFKDLLAYFDIESPFASALAIGAIVALVFTMLAVVFIVTIGVIITGAVLFRIYISEVQLAMIWAAVDWVKERFLRVVSFFWELMVIGWLAAYYICESLALTFTPSFLRTEKSLRGKVVVITGGAGGVGQELAVRLARNSAKVVIWDINESALEQVKERIESEGFECHTYVVDVADRHNVYKNADLVKSEIGAVDILINNAGIVCGQTLLDIPDNMIEKTFKVNIISHYWTVKAFLDDMIKRGRGHIVTVGSLTGMLGTYKCTDYSATKHATIGFHESLLTELKTHGHDNIFMTLVCPYFINTGMFAGCKPKNMSMLEPVDVAKRIVTAIKRNEVFVTMPTFSRYVLPLKNFIPAKLGWAVMYRIIQGPQSMMGMRNYQEQEAVAA